MSLISENVENKIRLLDAEEKITQVSTILIIINKKLINYDNDYIKYKTDTEYFFQENSNVKITTNCLCMVIVP